MYSNKINVGTLPGKY